MDERELAAAIALGQAHAPKIGRRAVLDHAAIDHPLNTVAYSMDRWCVHDYRNDCSGKICEAFRIPIFANGSWHGLSTVTMVTVGPVAGSVWFQPIPARELAPGDVVGIMGPGTERHNGHVRMFLGWDDQPGEYRCWEQSIGGTGPDRASHRDLADYGHGPYRAYRYTGIIEDLEEEEDMHMVRSGEKGDGSIYLAPGTMEAGKMVAIPIGPEPLYESYRAAGVKLVQLPAGMSVTESKMYHLL